MAPMKRSAEDPAGQMVLVPQKKQRNEMMIVNNASRCQERMIQGLIRLSENITGITYGHIFAGR